MSRKYQICTRCVMDTSAPSITFDANGVCSHCTAFLEAHPNVPIDEAEIARQREELHSTIRREGKGKRYDCIVGVSGGADSSYALYLAVQAKLRPLAVHLDNGWNSEIAQNNIANLVRQLGVDLYTHVIDWRENREMQMALFRAGVIDIEMIMDNAQAATTYRQAAKYGLRHILSGVNARTEGMQIPQGWYHYKYDVRNIRAINKRFGGPKIKTHPLMNTIDMLYFNHVRKIKYHRYPDYFLYNKKDAVALLQSELGYVPYAYKHNESVFTRFYQNYILPEKFGVDKRRVHHSNEICTGQRTREEALEDLKTNSYITSGMAASDKQYVIKKLGMIEAEFDEYMRRPPVPHSNYPSEIHLLGKLRRLYQPVKRLRRLIA